eukprot:3625864-Prorocentrum_lima.AAC.1
MYRIGFGGVVLHGIRPVAWFSGCASGVQTVPRAELMALLQETTKVPKTHADLWVQLKQHLQTRGSDVQVTK